MNNITKRYSSLPIQVRASFWFLVCTVLQRGVSIVTTPIFTRLLTASEYGTYSVFNSWMGIFSCFLTLNLFNGVFPQLVVKNEENKDALTMELISLTSVLTVFCGTLYLLIQRVAGIDIGLNNIHLMLMFVTIWADAVFGFWSYTQRVDFRYRALAGVTLCQAVAMPILCTVMVGVVPGDRITNLFIGIALVRLCCYGPLAVIQLRRSKSLYSADSWKHALALGICLIPHYLSGIVLSSSDRIMIERLVGSDEAGFYNLAYTISMAGLLINQAILQTLNPWLLRKIKSQEFSSMGRVSYLLLACVAVLNLVVLLFAPELLGLFAPAYYSDAIDVMPPVVMSVYFMFSYNFFSVFEFYYERTSYISIATTAGAIINVLLNTLLIPRFGYVAAGYTTLVCYAFFAGAHYCLMRRICRLELDDVRVFSLPALLGITIVFLCMGFTMPSLYSSLPIKVVVASAIVVIMYSNRKRILQLLRNSRSN